MQRALNRFECMKINGGGGGNLRIMRYVTKITKKILKLNKIPIDFVNNSILCCTSTLDQRNEI